MKWTRAGDMTIDLSRLQLAEATSVGAEIGAGRIFDARPHWGKVFLADATTIAPLYGRLSDFTPMVDRLDLRGAFSNAWLNTRVLGRRRWSRT